MLFFQHGIQHHQINLYKFLVQLIEINYFSQTISLQLSKNYLNQCTSYILINISQVFTANYRIEYFNMGKIIENYSLQTQLGSGVYSRVFKAINLKTKEEVAIKMVKADKFRELPKLEEGTINQINILSNLQPCPHIIRYYDMLKTVNNFYFVYEFCNGGTLEQQLKKSKLFEQHQALIYFKQITDAFKLLSKHNIMHRDLKPQNILLHDGIVKIADFGFCKVLENPDQMAQTMLGSPIYMAPEILKGQYYTMKADIWSLGVILFRMIFGYCPFQSKSIAKLIIILENEQLKIPTDTKINPIVIQLLRRMLTKDHNKRADWNEVFSYEISDRGVIKWGKSSDFLKNMNDTSFTSVNNSSPNSSYTNTNTNHNSSQHGQYNRSYTFSNRQFKHRQQFETNSSGYQGSDHQRNHLMPSNHRRTQVGSKSPLKEKNFKLDILLKSHSKCTEVTGLALEISSYMTFNSIVIGYILLKHVQCQLNSIYQSSRRQYQQRQNQQNSYHHILQITQDQLQNLHRLLEIFKSQIINYQNVNLIDLEKSKRKYLKQFIQSCLMQNLDELVMLSRIIDYLQESLLIRRQTYQKLSKQQLLRQIRNNAKLNETPNY